MGRDITPGVNNRKRLLAVMDILQRKTDEECGMSLSDIAAELRKHFGDTFRVTDVALREDIQSLRDFGMVIEEEKQLGFPTKYKWLSRTFDLYELRVLIDAVTSAHFLSAEDSEILIQKLKSLTSEHQAKRLGNRLFVDDHVKTTNKWVKFYIGDIHEAILQRRKITFQYRKFNVRKELQLHRNGFWYVVRPYALVWNQDRYYLLARQDGIDQLKTFRVDRLYKLRLLEERFEDPQLNVAQYIQQTFNMYPGEVTTVRVKFDNSLINVVVDRFGEQVALYPADESSFVIVIRAAMSEGLVRWLLTWGADAQVLSPPELVERMKEEIRKMTSLYAPGCSKI